MWQPLLVVLLATSAAAKCGTHSTCRECALTDGCSWCTNGHCVSSNGLECLFNTKIDDEYDCPVPVENRFEYDEALVKKVMLPLCSAAYSGHPQTCLTFLHDSKLLHQFDERCDAAKEDICSGLTAVSDYYKAIFVSFRGTMTAAQLFLEGAQTVFSEKIDVVGGGKASKYFYNAFKAVWDAGMMEDILAQRTEHPDYEIWVTGHSLGGSMASIAANVIVNSKIIPAEQLKLVTFGQPRTGDEDFAAAHDKAIPFTYRVTHKLDMVPHLPTEGYGGYKHHRYEVWYDNNMKSDSKYELCLSPEDGKCSDSNLVSYSIDDHLHYFGIAISNQFSCEGYKNM